MRCPNFTSAALLCVFLPLAGCEGAIGNTALDDGIDELCTEADEGCVDPVAPLRPPALRRLNRREFRNSVVDLFGLDTLPNASLPADTRSRRNFDTDGATSRVALGDAETFFNAADEVATHVLSEGRAPFAECQTLAGEALRACIGSALPAFLSQAFRRPLPVDAVAQVRMLGETDETYPDAVRTVIVSTLMSPYFLFHYLTPEEARLSLGVDGYETADRLAYFLWSSAPDAALLAAAEDGSLNSPNVLLEHTERLLADRRSERFLRDFASQWLSITAFIDGADDEAARQLFDDMREETERFVVAVLGQDEPLVRLLDADWSVLNARLAAHYGVDFDDAGDEWQVTEMPPHRRGLLAHGSLLTARTPTGTTNPFARGSWVAEYLACAQTPPPPAGVGELDADREATTIREQIEQHRADPVCASCHRVFDFYGLALEEFDGLGRYRSTYDNGLAIDPSGALPSGAAFANSAELALAMAQEESFDHCFAEQVATYGLGRNVEGPHAEALIERIEAAGPTRLSNVIHAVVTSPDFAPQGDDR